MRKRDGMCKCDTRYTGETVMERTILVNGKAQGMMRTCCFCTQNQLVVFGKPGDHEAFKAGEKTLAQIAPWADRVQSSHVYNLFQEDIVVLSAPKGGMLDAEKEAGDEQKPETKEEDPVVVPEEETPTAVRTDEEAGEITVPPKRRRGRPRKSSQ